MCVLACPNCSDTTLMSTSASRRRVAAVCRPSCSLIGGRPAALARSLNPGEVPDVVDPASGERLARPQAASTRQVEAAVTAAARSFAGWSALPGERRGDLLRHAADILAGTVDADAMVMTCEQGKTLTESRAEMMSIV